MREPGGHGCYVPRIQAGRLSVPGRGTDCFLKEAEISAVDPETYPSMHFAHGTGRRQLKMGSPKEPVGMGYPHPLDFQLERGI